MDWTYKNEIITETPLDVIGFVYLITNIINNRKYIGKKLFLFSKTSYKVVKQKNGVKKRKKIKTKIDSDWKNYWGSSTELTKDVAALGSENFTREILYYCKSKSELAYFEAKEQFDRRVLETNDYYNGIINCRINGTHILGKLSISISDTKSKPSQFISDTKS